MGRSPSKKSRVFLGLLPAALSLVFLVHPPPAPAADVYLRPPSDCPENGDGSSYACAASDGAAGASNTWDNVRSSLEPGDVLLVDGTWSFADYVSFRASGTEASPIRITSYDADNPGRITGSLGSALIYFQADYLEIDHLVFLNTDQVCLYLGQHGPDVIHRGQRVHHNHFEDCMTGLSISYIEDVDIHDNRFDRISSPTGGNQHHCIYPAQGTRGIRAYRNVCIAEEGIESSHCLHVYHSEPPGPPQDVEFHDNLCMGFTVGAGVYSGSQNVRVYGNTFIITGSFGGLRCNYGGSVASFFNNIVMGDPSYMGGINQADGCDITLDNNLYFQTSGTMQFLLDGVIIDRAAWQESRDQSSLFEDPLLVDPGSEDVHLSTGSPAIDGGDGGYASELDLYGQPRISGAGVDIGAAEYQIATTLDEETEPVDEMEPFPDPADETAEIVETAPEIIDAHSDGATDPAEEAADGAESGCGCDLVGGAASYYSS